MRRPAASIPKRLIAGLRRIAWLLAALSACNADFTGIDWTGWGGGPSGWGPFDFTFRYPEPAPVVGGVIFRQIAAAQSHVCGLGEDNVPRCWGDTYALPPAPKSGVPPATVVASGGAYSCAIDGGGLVRCWSPYSCWSPFGYTDECAANTVFRLPDTLRFRAIAAGREHTCGILDDFRAVCWGSGRHASLGRGDAGGESRDVLPVATDERFVSIAAGAYHTCALTASGTAHCWGLGDDGQTGSTTTKCEDIQCTPTPSLIDGGHEFVSLVLGSRRSCAIDVEGRSYCWGYHEAIDTTAPGFVRRGPQPTPLEVLGGIRFVQLSAGETHVCGVSTSGDAYCWGGDNAYGERGAHELGVTDRPTSVLGGLRFRAITAGNHYTCGLDTAGLAHCWGTAGMHLGRH